jgi:hypothetical protein
MVLGFIPYFNVNGDVLIVLWKLVLYAKAIRAM